MEHVKEKCNCDGDRHCMFCDGGLFRCKVCKGAEGTLTTKCSGKPISDRWLTCFVYHGRYDYVSDMLGGYVWVKNWKGNGGEATIVNKHHH